LATVEQLSLFVICTLPATRRFYPRGYARFSAGVQRWLSRAHWSSLAQATAKDCPNVGSWLFPHIDGREPPTPVRTDVDEPHVTRPKSCMQVDHHFALVVPVEAASVDGTVWVDD
jgi:hypothetical protein